MVLSGTNLTQLRNALRRDETPVRVDACPESRSCTAAMRRIARSLVLTVLCAARLAHADDPPRLATSWNQWEDNGASGVAKGVLLVAADAAVRLPSLADDAPRSLFVGIQLGGTLMVTDHVGLRADVTFHVHDDAPEDVRLIPMTFGATLHPLPKSPIDLYLGGRGGLAMVKLAGGGNELEPTVGIFGGLAFHYWGLFLVRAEAGYDLVRYASGPRTQSLDGPYLALGTGLAF
jgi:hypothetical protein